MKALSAIDEVRQRLNAVADPELDESVTELGFIQDIDIDCNNHVRVSFRLPTYWCAANFAFLMAQDTRDQIESIPWVRGVTVELLDHFSSSEINRGTAERSFFSATFEAEADGNLDDLRAVFRVKAFLRRQERLIRYLLTKACSSADQLIGLTILQLQEMDFLDEADASVRNLYLDARMRFPDRDPASPAFVTADGNPLVRENWIDHLQQLRRVSTNIEFNAVICRSLLEARNRGQGTT